MADEDDVLDDDVSVDCGECGEPIHKGDWPFCRSENNPDGHARGTYRFGMRSGMSIHKWEHSGSRSPR